MCCFVFEWDSHDTIQHREITNRRNSEKNYNQYDDQAYSLKSVRKIILPHPSTARVHTQRHEYTYISESGKGRHEDSKKFNS